LPGFDGTGPLGKGPFSGRGRGFCIVKLPDGGKTEVELDIAGDKEQKANINVKEVFTMPAGDRTGPLGLGPMTGRAAGYCAGYSVPGYMNPVPGRGFWGAGRGGGRGWRNWFYSTGLTGWQRASMGLPAFGRPWTYPAPYPFPPAPTMTKEQELDMLKGQAEYFEGALEGLKKRIEDLETKAEK